MKSWTTEPSTLSCRVKVGTVETAQVDRLRTVPPVHDESMPAEHESKNDSQFDPSLQCTDQT